MKSPLHKGCNYQTKWQSNKAMRFVLIDYDITTQTAKLKTRTTGSFFSCKISDLIFMETKTNYDKINQTKTKTNT
jgi:hypothetical protein